jgi:8-oxo-dGTP pyrophosphatase MutT (NUDIX family)
MKYRKGIFIVTYSITEKRIEYLILKRKLHWNGWEFPKGGKKFFESYKKAIKREIREETGQKSLKVIKFKEKGKYPYEKEFSDRKGFSGQSYRLYAVEIKKGEIRIDKIEHVDYKWVDFKKALKKLTWRDQKRCLKIVNEYLTKNKN